jgi:hypothetical protein
MTHIAIMTRYLIWISALCLLILLVEDIAAYKGPPTQAQLRFVVGAVSPEPYRAS